MKKFNRIAVVDRIKITDDALAKLQELSKEKIEIHSSDAGSNEEYIKRIGTAECVIGSWLTTINESILSATPNVKYIGICGTSLANIDMDAVRSHGITLKNVEDYGDESTAEYVFVQLLMLCRGYGKYQWKDEPTELFGKTFGIIGLGAVGQEVARLALGFGMSVSYYSKTRKYELEKKGLKYVSLNELLKSSDVISLHVPKNFLVLRQQEFDSISPGAILVDTCLGMVFDRVAFDNWVAKKENYIIFDHSKLEYFENVRPERVIGLDNPTAGITKESRQRLSAKVLENIESYLHG